MAREGMRQVPREQRRAEFEKLGPFITMATQDEACARTRSATFCFRLKGHAGTLHANLDTYDEPPGKGAVYETWFE